MRCCFAPLDFLEAILPVLAPPEVVDALGEEAHGGHGEGQGDRHGGKLVLLFWGGGC